MISEDGKQLITEDNKKIKTEWGDKNEWYKWIKNKWNGRSRTSKQWGLNNDCTKSV